MLKTNKLSLKYSSKEIFKEINISLDSSSKKKVALVGENGCGKSSLLKILNNEIKPSKGSLDIANEVIGYLPQEINFLDFDLVGELLESKIDEVWMDYKIDIALNEVGLDEECLIKELNKLSGGESVRVALAYLLLSEPSILLLDEPSNNLDIEGVDWLVDFISNFKGSVLFISHDRYLINKTVSEIWEIDPTSLNIEVYGGNYDNFLSARNKILEKRLLEYNKDNRDINSIEKWLKENEFHPKYRFSSFVMSQKAKLEKLRNNQIEKPVLNNKLKISNLSNKKRGLIFSLFINSKKFGEDEIIKDLELEIHKQERVLISGKNGSGKTTLLKIISGEDNDFSGELKFGEEIKIGYLKQFSSLNLNNSIIDEFEEKTGIIEPKSRSILASYSFKADKVINKVSTLSFGQLKRLELAIILAKEPNLLILDEPTNHLDIYTREELEGFILKQVIPMIIVSHDKYFINKLNIDKEICLIKY